MFVNAKFQIIEKISQLEKVDFTRVAIKEAMIGISHDQYLEIEILASYKGLKTLKMEITTYMKCLNSDVVVVYDILPEPYSHNITSTTKFTSFNFGPSASPNITTGFNCGTSMNESTRNQPTSFNFVPSTSANINTGFNCGTSMNEYTQNKPTTFNFGPSTLPNINTGFGSSVFSFNTPMNTSTINQPVSFPNNKLRSGGFSFNSPMGKNTKKKKFSKMEPSMDLNIATKQFSFDPYVVPNIKNRVNEFASNIQSNNVGKKNIKQGSYVWYNKKNAVVKVLDYDMESNSYTILHEDRIIDTTDEFLNKFYI